MNHGEQLDRMVDLLRTRAGVGHSQPAELVETGRPGAEWKELWVVPGQDETLPIADGSRAHSTTQTPTLRLKFRPARVETGTQTTRDTASRATQTKARELRGLHHQSPLSTGCQTDSVVESVTTNGRD